MLLIRSEKKLRSYSMSSPPLANATTKFPPRLISECDDLWMTPVRPKLCASTSCFSSPMQQHVRCLLACPERRNQSHPHRCMKIRRLANNFLANLRFKTRESDSRQRIVRRVRGVQQSPNSGRVSKTSVRQYIQLTKVRYSSKYSLIENKKCGR